MSLVFFIGGVMAGIWIAGSLIFWYASCVLSSQINQEEEEQGEGHEEVDTQGRGNGRIQEEEEQGKWTNTN